jgi:curved DNA-binding protein CbpA
MSLGEDLYETLGVSRYADKGEIKRAYIQLAKKWHPDKNRDSSDAVEMMEKINKAYRILSNDKDRKRYDLIGEEPDSSPPQGGRFYQHIFESSGFSFSSDGLPSDETNNQNFMDIILPASSAHPYLVYYYHNMCPRCISWTRRWEELIKYVKEFGVRTASINVLVSSRARIASKIYPNEVPKIGLLLKGNVYYFPTNKELSNDNIRSFIETLLPSNIQQISSYPFLSSNVTRIESNMPLVLFVSSRTKPSLSHKLISLSHGSYCQFAFMSVPHASSELLSHFKLSKSSNKKGLIIYKEFQEPAIHLMSSEMTKEKLRDTIEENKFLYLPRISSSGMFDILCPHGVHIK